MPDADAVERAQALLERTREILASVEAEVAKLAEETAAAKAQLREWEATLVHLLPEENAPASDEVNRVVSVGAPDAAPESAPGGGSVYAVERREGPRVVTRE